MKKTLLLFMLCCAILLSACAVPHADPTATPTEEPSPTETPIPEPTPTFPPAAARVNGLVIAIEDVDLKRPSSGKPMNSWARMSPMMLPCGKKPWMT